MNDRTARQTRMAVQCPQCSRPFHWAEVGFHVVNDEGYWKIECGSCRAVYAVSVRNPYESLPTAGGTVLDRREAPYDVQIPFVRHALRHTIEPVQLSWIYNYKSAPLYYCPFASEYLDETARSVLADHSASIMQAWHQAEPQLMKLDLADIALVRCSIPCSCKGPHEASFHAATLLGVDSHTQFIDRCRLNDISWTVLEFGLGGVYSKSDVMRRLGKLLIRWHAAASQILIAAPFVGHNYLNSPEVLDLWRWLERMLDPGKAVLLTRPGTWKTYATAAEKQLHDVALLKSFGLFSRTLEVGMSKLNFHAKFYAALIKDQWEIFSGSANLLSGPSVENMSFQRLDADIFESRYIRPLNLTLPSPVAPPTHYALVARNDAAQWRVSEYCGSPLAPTISDPLP